MALTLLKQSCNDECLQSQTKCSNDQSTLKVTAALKYSTTLSPHWFLIFKIFLFKSSRPRNISDLNSSDLYWLPSLQKLYSRYIFFRRPNSFVFCFRESRNMHIFYVQCYLCQHWNWVVMVQLGLLRKYHPKITWSISSCVD